MKNSSQAPLQMQALSKVTVNPCMYGTVMFIFNYHVLPLQTDLLSLNNIKIKNYTASNQGLSKLNVFHGKFSPNIFIHKISGSNTHIRQMTY